MARVDAGNPSAADIKFLGDKLKMPLSDIEERAAIMAERQDEIARAAYGDVPNGIERQDGAVLVERALREVYEGGDVLMEGVNYAPKREAGLAQILDDGFVPKVGSKVEVGGRPVTYRQIAPEKIGVDAGSYQYKAQVDANGVNGRLSEVTQWDKTGTGKVFVHERKDGLFVVDGHQRLDLAKRLSDGLGENDRKIKLNAHVFKEKDGWTVEDVRALAAKKNIGEGSGSVMDGARATRQRGDIVDDGLPLASEKMKDMLGLARLSDEAWAAVEAQAVKPEYGATVGRMVPDEAMQARVLDDLARAQPATREEAAEVIGESLEAGYKREKPDGLNKNVENEPEILKPQQAIEPASREALDMAERELAVMEGRLADKPNVATMWEDIVQASFLDDGLAAKQVQTMANVVRACRL